VFGSVIERQYVEPIISRGTGLVSLVSNKLQFVLALS